MERAVLCLAEEISEGRSMINRVLEIDAEGQMDFYGIPS